jgi:hypothetical protein
MLGEDGIEQRCQETCMSGLVMIIGRLEDEHEPEVMTEMWRQRLPDIEQDGLDPQRYIDQLESKVGEVGFALMRQLMVEQWRLTDERWVARYQAEAGGGVVVEDGHDSLKVASRYGVVHLPRQVCYRVAEKQHVLPGNAGLPVHTGQVTTRGLQEWACLLTQDLPFATAQRLLGWITHDNAVLSTTQLRRVVVDHGQIIRAAELAELTVLQAAADLTTRQASLVPIEERVRHAAAWPAELNQVVDVALSQAHPQTPQGVSEGDWERVLHVRQTDRQVSAEQLRCLGPAVPAGEVMASTDDIQVRQPQHRRWLELRTAYVRTAHGYRYLSGSADTVLQQLFVLLILCGGGLTAKLTLLGDGAQWIAAFFCQRLADWPGSQLILDWYHCRKRCYELSSGLGLGRAVKTKLLGRLLFFLWRGQVDEALDYLETYRAQAKNTTKLDDLIAYLTKRRAYIPNYKARRTQRLYIGSAHVEKANDLIVARRQKHRAMHWSDETSDALAALRTLLLNGGWDLYWQDHQVLPLAIPCSP